MPEGGIRRRTTTFLSLYGAKETAANVLVKAGLLVARPGWRKAASPNLSHLDESAAAAHTSPEAVVRSAAGDLDDQTLAALRAEFEPLVAELADRARAKAAQFPTLFHSTPAMGFVLYALTRLHRPTTVVETGVADGHSSFFLLRAMAANGTGSLISLDVDPAAGGLLGDAERARWRLELVDPNDPKRALETTLAELGTIDVFFHDSCHDYRWQEFELDAGWRHLAPDGLVLCDDVDDSFAFIDFCATTDRRPVLLVEPNKVFGVLPPPNVVRKAAS
jgi:predicted O-methyltransferase YrrM